MKSQETMERQLDSFDNFPLEVSRDRVEALWRQAIHHRATARAELSPARQSRARAEMERQRVCQETLAATRESCKEIVAESERKHLSARQVEAEAKGRWGEAEKRMEQVLAARAEADAYREKVMAECSSFSDQGISKADAYRTRTMGEADAYRDKLVSDVQQEAQRVREEARASAVRECEDLKRHVTYEVQCILSEVDALKAAAEEELEAQRIYAETANIRTMSRDVRARVIDGAEGTLNRENGSSPAGFGQQQASDTTPIIGVQEHSPLLTANGSQTSYDGTTGGLSDQVVEAKGSRNGKPSSRTKA